MIDGVRAALDEMAVAKSMVQHQEELEAAQEAARNAAAEAHAEGYYKDKQIKKQDKKLGNTKEEVKYPHMMYDPKTGKEVEAKTPEDHEKLAKMGYTHEKPDVKEFVTVDGAKRRVKEGDQRLKANKEDASNDKSDDGDGMDKVDPKAAKKKFADRKDKDIDNDGDVDDSDKFLHKRRKAIGKTMQKEGTVRERLMSIWEDAAGAKRMAGATEAEPMTKGDEDKKMKAGHPVAKADMADSSDAAEKATKPAAMRGNDNKQAEKNIKPSATKDTANKVSAKESIDAIAAAYEGMKKDG